MVCACVSFLVLAAVIPVAERLCIFLAAAIAGRISCPRAKPGTSESLVLFGSCLLSSLVLTGF